MENLLDRWNLDYLLQWLTCIGGLFRTLIQQWLAQHNNEMSNQIYKIIWNAFLILVVFADHITNKMWAAF